jgi:hypothetical protein
LTILVIHYSNPIKQYIIVSYVHLKYEDLWLREVKWFSQDLTVKEYQFVQIPSGSTSAVWKNHGYSLTKFDSVMLHHLPICQISHFCCCLKFLCIWCMYSHYNYRVFEGELNFKNLFKLFSRSQYFASSESSNQY